MTHPTREQYLEAAVEQMRKLVFMGYTVPKVKVSVGFPKGARKAIGQCFNPDCCEAKVSQIFVSPTIEDPIEALATLAHELIHAMHPEAKHRGQFRMTAIAIGLEGKMTETTAGPELEDKLSMISHDLGPYPHSALNLQAKIKKEGTRMLKIKCPNCGYTARTTRQWLDEVGALICPCQMIRMEEE